MLRASTRLYRQQCLTTCKVLASQTTLNVTSPRCQSTATSSASTKKSQYPSPAELRQAWQNRRQPLFDVIKMRDLVTVVR